MISITLEQLLRSFKKKSIQEIYGYMVNETYQNYYDTNKESSSFNGLSIQSAADIDISKGFNKLKPLRHYSKYAAKDTRIVESYKITDIGDKLKKALYVMTGYKHGSLEDLGLCADCEVSITYDKHGNILHIDESSQIYAIVCQLVSTIPILTVQLTDRIMLNAVEYLVLLQTPTNIEENYGMFNNEHLYIKCLQIVESLHK